MGKTYGSDHVQLKPAKITHSVHAGIGRLIRAFAEIEDMLDLFIGTLAEISESQATVILGTAGITRRLTIAEKLATLRTDGALSVYKAAFNDTFNTLSELRNAVAHGTLLGQNEKGRLFFETTSMGPKDGNNRAAVYSYMPRDIIANGAAAEQLATRIEQLLQVREQREARLQRPLNPHPKARIPRSAKS